MLYALCIYLGFCAGCSLVSDLNYNNNLEHDFRFNRVPWHIIVIRVLISSILVPFIFISEVIEYINSKYI